MSSDRQTDGDVLAMNGAAAALGISHLPFQGPLGSVRLGLVDGQFIPFPTQDELEASTLDLIVSGTRDAVLMIEGFGRELPEDEMLEAIMRPTVHPRAVRLAAGAGRQGRHEEDGLHAAGERRSVRSADEHVLRPAEGRQADRRQACPRRGVAQLKSQALPN